MALDQKIKTQLQAYMEKIENTVELKYFKNDTEKSMEMVDLIKEVNLMSDKINTIEGDDSNHRSPSFQVNRPGESTGIIFAGIPMGHEFTSFYFSDSSGGRLSFKNRD
jgi:alkyl hydroperoxide reductase subunit F